jgi:hypothetical protein
MTQKLTRAAIVAACTLLSSHAAFAAKPATVPTASAEDVAALRAQLQALIDRVAQLETAQTQQADSVQTAVAAVSAQQTVNNDVQNALDLQSDNLAKTAGNVGDWVGRFTWKGDLRWRNEQFQQQYVTSNRIRDRIRARAGFVAKVNDTVRAELQFATGGADPRSSNQTLTDNNSRKALDLDLAYAEWQATPSVKVAAGKMKYPWVRPGQSMFFDGDVNPEGVAIAYQGTVPGGFFGSAFYNNVTERSAFADSNMIGVQAGWRSNPALRTRFTVGATYFDHGATQGYNPFATVPGTTNGNTTTTSRAICRNVIATCLQFDYNIVEVFGEVATTLADRPFTAFVDYARNGDAVLDTAYSLGFQYGRASNPNTWEVGLQYQKIEKDSLFAQTVDSDFADGNTDGDGFALRFGYAFARNFRFNATYFMNDLNNDVATTVTGVTGPVFNRDYKRMQLDLNWGF